MRAFKHAGGLVGTEVARRVALAVAKEGSVDYDRYLELCGRDVQTANFLLQRNIFVEDVADRVRFENIILESAVKQYMVELGTSVS